MIDRSDEFQVANTILSFKSYQFLTGLYYACTLSYGLYGCLGSGEYDLGTRRPCDASMPSASSSFDIFMLFEIPRLATLVVATLMLRGGHTYGGIGELRALAEVRLDMADGSFDGFANTAKITLEQVDVENLRDLCHTLDPAEWRRHVDAARIEYGAAKGTGGYLVQMMFIDLALLVCIASSMLAFFWCGTEPQADGGRLMFRNTLSYISITWALMSFPFLIFHFPVVGPALSTPYYTGYSTLGVLVPQLSSSAIVRKETLAKERALRRKELAEDSSTIGGVRRWWHYSSARRVVRDVLDLVNPFDNQLNVNRFV